MAHFTLISDAIVVNPTLPPEVIDRGWVLIEDDRIKTNGDGPPPTEWTRRANEHIDARGSILLPGLVNTHNHASMTLFRGLADDLPLQDWLEGIIFPAEARVVDREFCYWGTLLACVAMMRSAVQASRKLILD